MKRNLIASRSIPVALLIASALAPANPQATARPVTNPVTLKLGDPAPSVAGLNWIKGQPLASFTDGKVHVLEFWATWCGPCKAAMPHLSELAEQYKGQVEFYGIDIGENVTKTSGVDYLPKVKRFVDSAHGMLTYNVGVDDPAGTMSATWMKPAGQRGIPASFVVDRHGKIAFIGPPMILSAVLPLVLQDKFDAKQFAADYQVIAEKANELLKQYEQAEKAGDFKTALTLLDQYEKVLPERWGAIDMWRYILLAKSDPAVAHAYGEGYIKKLSNSPEGLISFSRLILGDYTKIWGVIPNPDYPLGLKAAQMAIECSDPTSPDLNGALADSYFKAGDAAKAAMYEQRVLATYAADKTIPWRDDTKAEAKSKLETYRAAEKSRGSGPLE